MMRRLFQRIRSWAGPLLIVLALVGTFWAGWSSGKAGSFVSDLVRVANAKSEIESNLDKALQALGGKSEEAARLAKEKVDLVKRMRDLERRVKAAAAKPRPKASPKAKVSPPPKKARKPSPIKSCRFVHFVMVCP